MAAETATVAPPGLLERRVRCGVSTACTWRGVWGELRPWAGDAHIRCCPECGKPDWKWADSD